MGNAGSSPHPGPGENKENVSSFPGSAIVDALNCGILDDAEDTPKSTKSGTVKGSAHRNHNSKRGGGHHGNYNTLATFFSRTEELCAMSPTNSEFMAGGQSEFYDQYEEFGRDVTIEETGGGSRGADEQNDLQSHSPQKKQEGVQSPANPTSALFAKALVSEVTDNPNTMTPAAMADREKRLLKAQDKARKSKGNSNVRPVGVPGGVGQTSVLGSIAHALTGTTDPLGVRSTGMASSSSGNDTPGASVLPPNSMSENRAAQVENSSSSIPQRAGKHTVTIGLSLTRRSSVGHPDTVTRQTAFDFNELQDREYKYVSSTDSSGWRAGGGERGGPVGAVDTNLDEGDPDSSGSGIPQHMKHPNSTDGGRRTDGGIFNPATSSGNGSNNHPGTPNPQDNYKISAHDTVHIPIIHIDAESPHVVDSIIAALARGEVFIPHMAIIPEALSVNGVSPPDLVVRFGTERNDDLPPDEWPNWCLEFMHNQLYEYFHGMGARWMKRPFSITLARKVRWKTVKHMNRYFAHAEHVIDAWREKGPQYLDPQLAYIEGGATPEEVARPHGVYLLRNGIPTNYFAPNFDPPYTTKMTRSLLLNVLAKSWDKKRREWTSEPIPRLVTPAMLVTAMCGCGENQAGGFIATEATFVNRSNNGAEVSTVLPADADIRSFDEPPREKKERKQSTSKSRTSGRRDNTGSATDTADSSSHQPIGSTETTLKSLQSPHRETNTGRNINREADNSYVHERMLAHADYSHARTDQVTKPADPQGSSALTRSNNNDGDNLDVRMELQMSTASTSFAESEANSNGNGSNANQRSVTSAFSAVSSKYGRPLTPEGIRSPRSGFAATHEDELMEQQRTERQNEPENTKREAESIDPSAAAASDTLQPPVSGFNSTTLHTNNVATATVIKQQLKPSAESRSGGTVDDEKKEEDSRDPSGLSSDEDWLEELAPKMKPEKTTEKISSVSASGLSQQDNMREMREALDRERVRQIELIAMVQEQTSHSASGRRKLAELVADASEHSQLISEIGRPRSPSLRKTDSGTSGISLEYSIDSAVVGENSLGGSTLGTFTTLGGSTVGSSTLLGQHYAPEGATIASNVSRSTRDVITEILQESSHSGEDSQSSAGSAEEPVPNDEDLFAVGWAKALDASSGSYYYFTLDRKQIVWDNPLAPPPSMSQSVDESLHDSIPE